MSGLLLMSAFFSACTRSPQDIIHEGMKKFAEAPSYAFVGSVDADISSAATEGLKNVKVALKAKGAFEGKDPQNLNMNLQLDASTNADGIKTDGSFEGRLQKDMVYFLISKLNAAEISGENPFQNYLKKWYSVQIPPEFMDQLKEISAKSKDDTQLTPQQKQLKDLYEKTNFLMNPTLVGTDEVNGEKSSHFKADLDKKAIVDFSKKVAEIQGNSTTQTDVDQFQALLDKLAVATVELWIDDTSGYLNQVQVSLQSTQDAVEKGTVTLKATMSDFGKPVTIEIPKDVEPFPVLDFLLGGVSSETMGPSEGSNKLPPQPVPTPISPKAKTGTQK